jgi:non-homologous end joining protein Ku
MQSLTNAITAGVTLSYGMIAVPVSVHAAVGEEESSGMRIVCVNEHAATPTKTSMQCPVCASQNRSTFVKARQIGDGFVVVPPEVIADALAAAVPFKKSLSLTVHPAEQVSSVLLPSGKSYYLSLKNPVKGVLDAYSALSALITDRPDLAFMTKFSMRGPVSLFQLTVAGPGTLVLRQMSDAALVREHPAIEFTDVTDSNRQILAMIAERDCVDFVATDHGSGQNTIIADYAATQTPVAAEATGGVVSASNGTVVDITSLLASMLAEKSPAKASPKKRAARPRRSLVTTESKAS